MPEHTHSIVPLGRPFGNGVKCGRGPVCLRPFPGTTADNGQRGGNMDRGGYSGLIIPILVIVVLTVTLLRLI